VSHLESTKEEGSCAVRSDIAGTLFAFDGTWDLGSGGGGDDVSPVGGATGPPRLRPLGILAREKESHQRHLLRSSLLGLQVRFGEASILEEAVRRFSEYREDPARLPADLRFAVFLAQVSIFKKIIKA